MLEIVGRGRRDVGSSAPTSRVEEFARSSDQRTHHAHLIRKGLRGPESVVSTMAIERYGFANPMRDGVGAPGQSRA